MKRVGVVLRTEETTGILKHYVRDSLLNKIINYDIEIICIPIINKISSIYQILDTCDGVILPGGDDILDKDIQIIDYLYKEDIPTFGICLGMQEMAFYKNGSLDVLNDAKHYNTIHNITIYPNSILFKIFKNNKIVVNSIHNSIVVKTNLSVSAISEDNIIEAIEDKSKKFFLGVQWHPERMKVEESTLLFDYFISKL